MPGAWTRRPFCWDIPSPKERCLTRCAYERRTQNEGPRARRTHRCGRARPGPAPAPRMRARVRRRERISDRNAAPADFLPVPAGESPPGPCAERPLHGNAPPAAAAARRTVPAGRVRRSRPMRRARRPAPGNRAPRPRTAPAQSGLNARRLALEVLTDVREKGAYASLALGRAAARCAPVAGGPTAGHGAGVRHAGKPAANRLCAGPPDGPSHPRARAARHPAHGRVSDSVSGPRARQRRRGRGGEAHPRMGMEAACGFINAVLRNLSRGKDEIAWPDREADLTGYLSVKGSMPRWLVEKLVAAYGPEEGRTRHPLPRRGASRMRQAQFHAPVRR